MKKLIIHPDEITDTWINRLKEHNIEILGIHSEGGTKAHEHLEEMLALCKTPAYREIIDKARAMGLKIHYELHAASYLLPRDLFDQKPEWFRMDENGNRVREFNFCVSNPDALSLVTNRAAELADNLYGTDDFFYLWMDDGVKNFCQCEKCKVLSPSDQQLMVMNAVLKKLKIKRPKAKIAYLAYYDAITPPAFTKPESGIFVEYAPYKRDFTKPAKDMPEADVQNISKLLDFFGREDATVLEYWYDNSLYSEYKKPPKLLIPHNDHVKADIPFYENLGFKHISSFACFLGPDYEELHGEPDISAFVIN